MSLAVVHVVVSISMMTLLLLSSGVLEVRAAAAFAGPIHRRVTRSWTRQLCRHFITSSSSCSNGIAASASASSGATVPDDWGGATHKKSEFITHFVAGQQPDLTVEDAVQNLLQKKHDGDIKVSSDAAARREVILRDESDPLLKEVEAALRHNTSTFPLDDNSLSAIELLALGSIWYLPASAPRDPTFGGKPIRLSAADAQKLLDEGDYLRVHNPPRRFPAVNMFDWGKSLDETGSEEEVRGVVVAQDDDIGYMVVDKPQGLPVHGTVDNTLENVASALGRSLLWRKESALRAVIEERNGGPKSTDDVIYDDSFNPNKKRKYTPKDRRQKKDPLVYISSPQRLDQNTSGLFVLSTKKQFASYFAKLLRKKTNNQLSDDKRGSCAVHKTYRCLVCVSQGRKDEDGTSYSVGDDITRLRRYAHENAIIRHWLEPSVKAPKTFSAIQVNSTWAECLMKLKNVGEAYPIVGNDAADLLSQRLWEVKGSKPTDCAAVVEVEIELLTGRTHQIRGQMSSEGFPLVGDVSYGGAIPISNEKDSMDSVRMPEKLALQCCQLEFLEPDFVEKKGELVGVRSDRWKTFRLEKAWWTPMIEEYVVNGDDLQATFSRSDEENVRRLKEVSPTTANGDDAADDDTDAALLPPRVQLSAGKNKYVIIEAMRKSSPILRFVRSACPSECGGPYHADVARSLVEQLTSLGYKCTVEGGGRIDFVSPHAHVYGFSYGFGKGDHEMACQIIEEYSEEETYATFDESDALY